MSTYTPEMLAELRANAPLSMDKAKEIAGTGDFANVTWRSIVAKAKREGIAYENAKPEAKKGRNAPTKAEIVSVIEEESGLTLVGLEKAPVKVLNALAEHFMPPFADGEAEADADAS